MTAYEAALFLHIVGLTGMFAGIGVTMTVLHFARRAETVSAVRPLMPLAALGGKTIPLFSVLVLVTGVYMVEDVWKWDVGWIQVSLATFVILFAMGPLINARRTRAIGMEAQRAPDGAVSGDLARLLEDPVLHTSEITMTLATVGIIYLMVVKPGTGGSLLAIAVAVAAGLAISAQAWMLTRSQAREQGA